MAFSGTYKKHLEEVEKSASSSDGKTLSEGNTLSKGKFSGTYNAYKSGAYDPFKTKNIAVDYSTLNQNADWDKYSSDLKWKGITDTTAAHIINTDKDLWGAKVWETIDKATAPLFGSQTLPYRYMTDNERQIYTYLHENPQYGVDYANDYIKSLDLNKRSTADYTDFYKDLADENPALASANSTALNVINGFAQINPMTMANKATSMMTKGWDGYSAYNPDNLLSNISTTERNRVTENIENPVGQFAYQTGMSMADSTVNMLLFGEGARAVMGINAANARKKELEDAGAPPQQVMAGSLLSGGIEALTESFSIGNFLKPKGIDSLGKLLKEVGKQILTEGSEEVASDALNDIVDIAMGKLGGYSEIEENKKAYMAQGMSDSDATKRLVADSLKEAALSFLGGGISGGLMGAPAFTYQWHNNANIGSQIASQERVEDLSEQASKYGREDLSEALQGTPKDATIGMAQTELLKELQEKASSKNATEEDKKRYDEAYRAYALNVSSPKTGITDKDGNVLHVNGIKIVDDELVFETDNGDVAATDTRIANDDIFMMRKFANMIPDDQQKVFAENYKAGENVAQYIKAFEDAYTYGTLGHEADKNMLVENGRLTVEQANNIYQAGYNSELSTAKSLDNARVAIANYRSLIPNADVRAKIDASVISMDGSDPNKVDFNSLTDNQKATIAIAEALASKWNFNIKFFDSSRETGDLKRKNGKYVWKTNTVWLDINAENTNSKDRTNAILTTLSHELTHWAKYNSPDLYEVFKQEMLSTLAKQAGKAVDEKTSITAYVQDQKSKYKEYRKLSMETTEDELVARACENMLLNSELMQETLSKMSPQERQTFVGKIKEFLKNIMNALKDIMGRFDSQSKQYLLLSKDVEVLKDLQKKWDAMIKDAAVNSAYTNAAIEKGIADGILLEGSKTDEMAFSEKTWEDRGKEFLADYLDSQVESGQILSEERDSIMNGMMAVYDAMHNMLDKKGNPKYESYSNWAEAGMEVRGEDGNVSVIVNNGEYALNIDFATVCKKREVLDMVLNKLVKAGDLNLYTLTRTDINKINETIKSHGFEIACGLCFVDSKRYNVGKWSRTFEEKYNNVLYQFADANGKTVDEFNYTGRDINNPKMSLLSNAKKVDTSVLDKIIKENTNVKNGKESLNEVAKIALAMKSNRQLWHKINASEIIASEGLDAIRLKNRALYDLINNHEGTAKPKLSHSRVPYVNDILENNEFNADAAFAVGGVRVQSFSDFVPVMIFDYVQMVSELQAKGLPSHAYTKELTFAKLFGMCGMKINLSAIPRGKHIPSEWITIDKEGKVTIKKEYVDKARQYRAYTGLKTNEAGYPVDKNGKEITRNLVMTQKELSRAVYETDDESINLEEAIKLQNAEGYDKNVGVIFVGASSNAIWKMLTDKDIPMVIPYHSSSINPVIAQLRNIASYQDFTTQQNTRDANGKKLTGKKNLDYVDWYTLLKENNYDAVSASKEYVRRCEEKGWLPKFDEFVYLEDGSFNTNYYKLLEDFRMYDKQGNIAQQKAVKLFADDGSINMPSDAFKTENGEDGFFAKELQKYEDTMQALDKGGLDEITEEIRKTLKETQQNEMASEKDNLDESNKTSYSNVNENMTEDEIGDAIINNGFAENKKEASYAAKGAKEILRNAFRGRFSNTLRAGDRETIALGITNEFVHVGRIDWRGRKLNSDNIKAGYELATYAQVLRSPLFETFRVFYTKGDTIVANDATTTYLTDLSLVDSNYQDIKERMERYGADGYFLLHNHPSGNPVPSKGADIPLTQAWAKAINGFRGHIVIDHNQYAYIDANGNSTMYAIKSTNNYNQKVVDHLYLGKKLTSPDTLAEIAESIAHRDNYSVIVYASSSGEIRCIEEVHDNFILPHYRTTDHGDYPQFEGYLANKKLKVGSAWAFLITGNDEIFYNEKIKDLCTRNLLRDAVNSKTFATYYGNGIVPREAYASNGKPKLTISNHKINEERSSYVDADELSSVKQEISSEDTSLNSWKDEEGYLHLDFDDVISIDDFEKYLKKAGIKLKERETTKEKYEEALKEVRLRLKTAEEQVRQSAQRDRLVKKIIEREDKLVTMFQKNDSKNHIPDVLKESLVKVLTSVDLASELPKGKLLNHLNAFKDVISKNVPTEEEAMDNLGKYFDTDGYFVEAVQGIIDELNEEVDEFTEGKNNVSLYNLSWQSLNKLNEVLTAIGVAARQYDTALGTDKKATISGRAKSSMDFLKNKVPMAVKNSVQKFATSFLGWDNITPIYGYDRFGEGGKQTFKEFIEGDDVATAHEKETIAYAEKYFTAEEAEKWSNDVHDVTIGGKTYPMTTAQIMSLYCLYRRESTHQHLFRAKNVYGNYIDGQGIVIGEINGKSTETGEIKITEDEINTIIKELDDKQRKVAEALQEFMSTTCADWGNYVTMKRWGIMMFGEENYFPMQVYAQKRNVTAQENNKQASLFQLLNMGFTKSLDPKSSSALIISSIFDVFTKHTSEMASYNAYALAVLDTLKWLNYTEREDGKTLAFKEVIKQVYDKDGKNFIINHIRDLNGQRMELDSADKVAKKIIKHYKTAATAANLRVVVMQPTAILRAYNVIDGKYIVKALTSGFSAIKQAKAEMNEKSMLAVRKNELGSLDANLSKTIEENVMRTNELKTFKGRMGKLMDASLILAEKADEITWATLYKAVQLEMQEKTNLTGAEFDKAVTERFEDICYRTQVFDSINARSGIMRKKDMWHTMLTAFGAEPTLSYSMLSNEVFNFMIDARGGNIKRSWSMHSKNIKRAFVAFMMTAVAVSAVAAVPDWFRDDDDEKSVIETYFKNFGMNLLGEATGLLPYIRDAYSIIVDGRDPSRPDEEIFASFRKECKALANAFDEGRVTYRSVYQSAKLFSQITGTPLGNVIRDFKAIWNKTVGEIFDMKIE